MKLQKESAWQLNTSHRLTNTTLYSHIKTSFAPSEVPFLYCNHNNLISKYIKTSFVRVKFVFGTSDGAMALHPTAHITGNHHLRRTWLELILSDFPKKEKGKLKTKKTCICTLGMMRLNSIWAASVGQLLQRRHQVGALLMEIQP